MSKNTSRKTLNEESMVDLTKNDDFSETSNGDDWQQVTPKKSHPVSSGVMQNKFVLMGKSTDDMNENNSPYSSNSPYGSSKKSSNSLNRFNALLASSENNRSSSNGLSRNQSISPFTIKGKPASLPDLSQSGSQAALQKRISSKFKEMRKKGVSNGSSSKSSVSEMEREQFWLSNPANLARFRKFVNAFEWSNHESKLENLWFSILGNPQKFIFILLDYLEECFGDVFPSVTVTSENFMDELPSSIIFDPSLLANEAEDDFNNPNSLSSLIDSFKVKIESKIETFLRQKLESPEFNIEEIFHSLFEIILKCQRFKYGSNSFASFLILSKLLKIFPFQSLLAVRELVLSSQITLSAQGYFYLWVLWVIFEEEPSQSNSLGDLILDEICNKWESLPNHLLSNSLQTVEDFCRETAQCHSENCAYLSEVCQKTLLRLLALNQSKQQANTKNFRLLSRSLEGIFTKILGIELAVCLNGNCCIVPLVPILFEVADEYAEFQSSIFLFLISCSSSKGSQKYQEIYQSISLTHCYEKYLGSVSFNFLTFIANSSLAVKEDVREFCKRLHSLNKNISSDIKRWNASGMDQFGFRRSDAIRNNELLESIINQPSSSCDTASSRLRTMKNFIFGKTLFSFLLRLIFFTVLFFLIKNPSQIDYSKVISRLENNKNPIISNSAKTGKVIVLNLKSFSKRHFPTAKRNLKRFVNRVLLAREQSIRTVQLYKPALHAISRRYGQHSLALIKKYCGTDAVVIYKQRANQIVSYSRGFLRKFFNQYPAQA